MNLNKNLKIIIMNVMEIDIASGYVSEGIYTIPHEWGNDIWVVD